MKLNKIMLIEDDSTMVTLLKTFLEFEGFEISPLDTYASITEILGCIRQEKPDIVLLDVHLNNFSGFDLLKAIRDDLELKDLLILMSSGMDFQTRCSQEGADSFILKPYMPDQLTDAIKKMIHTKESNRRN